MCYRISHIWSLGEPVPFWNTELEAPLSFPAGGAGTASAPECPPARRTLGTRLSLLHRSLVGIHFSPAASANAGARSAVTASIHSKDRRSKDLTALQTSLRVL